MCSLDEKTGKGGPTLLLLTHLSNFAPWNLIAVYQVPTIEQMGTAMATPGHSHINTCECTPHLAQAHKLHLYLIPLSFLCAHARACVHNACMCTHPRTHMRMRANKHTHMRTHLKRVKVGGGHLWLHMPLLARVGSQRPGQRFVLHTAVADHAKLVEGVFLSSFHEVKQKLRCAGLCAWAVVWVKF